MSDCDTVSDESDYDVIEISDIVSDESDNDVIEISDNVSDESDNDVIEISDNERKKTGFTEIEDEIQIVFESLKALKEKPDTCLTSFVSEKVTSTSLKPKPNEELDNSESESFDPEDLCRSNIFLVSRSYVKFRNPYEILKWCLKFSKLSMDRAIIPYENGNIQFVLATKVNNQVLILGKAINNNRKCGKKMAAINAIENLSKKCFTIEIKKKKVEDREISIDFLNQKNRNKHYGDEKEIGIGSDSIGAKMLKLMGWSGGGLGKIEDGIKKPLSVEIIGRSGLGSKNEDFPTPIFKRNVRKILNEMRKKVSNSVDNIGNIVFSADLSDQQRNYIHSTVFHKYKELKSMNLGVKKKKKKKKKKTVLVKPLVDKKLVPSLLSQGGSTDMYEIHKPGTLTLDFFFS